MNDKKWKSGDIVMLKIGGPKMMVDRYVPFFPPASFGHVNAVDAKALQEPTDESVRCCYFTPACNEDGAPSHGGASYPTFIEFHEDTLKAVTE